MLFHITFRIYYIITEWYTCIKQYIGGCKIMTYKKDEYEVSTKGTLYELNSKITNGNFTKNANKGNAPKASDIVNQITKTIKKKDGE